MTRQDRTRRDEREDWQDVRGDRPSIRRGQGNSCVHDRVHVPGGGIVLIGYDDTAVGGDGGGAGSMLARSSNRMSPRSDRSRSSCWYAKRASGGGRDRDVAARSGARPGALPVLACRTQCPLPTTSALLLRAGLLLAAGRRGVGRRDCAGLAAQA